MSPHHHPTSIPHPTPPYPGWVPANDTKGRTVNYHVMHNVQQQLNNMMAVMSPTPAS